MGTVMALESTVEWIFDWYASCFFPTVALIPLVVLTPSPALPSFKVPVLL